MFADLSLLTSLMHTFVSAAVCVCVFIPKAVHHKQNKSHTNLNGTRHLPKKAICILMTSLIYLWKAYNMTGGCWYSTRRTEIHMAVSFSADGNAMLMEAEFPVLPSK